MQITLDQLCNNSFLCDVLCYMKAFAQWAFEIISVDISGTHATVKCKVLDPAYFYHSMSCKHATFHKYQSITITD